MSPIPFMALPSLIDWPRDEAAHTGMAWEIWWVTAVVRAGGRRLAAHVLFNHLGAGNVYVTATLTDVDREVEATKRMFAQGDQAVLTQGALGVETALAGYNGSFADGYRFRADLDDSIGFDLLLKPTRPVLHNGGSGRYDFQGTTTTQYSIGFLETSGSVRLDGKVLSATGSGWYDRQWDAAKRAKALAFTWFGLCLDNGDTLSVFDTGGHRWATVARPDGTHIVTAVEITTANEVQTALGRTVPRRWTLGIPALHAQLDLAQRLVTDDVHLYTGVLDVTGRYEDADTQGYGFCDVVGPLDVGPLDIVPNG